MTDGYTIQLTVTVGTIVTLLGFAAWVGSLRTTVQDLVKRADERDEQRREDRVQVEALAQKMAMDFAALNKTLLMLSERFAPAERMNSLEVKIDKILDRVGVIDKGNAEQSATLRAVQENVEDLKRNQQRRSGN